MKRRALISGGGIAGLSLGFWLERIGIEPVIIERAARFEALGHYIALKGNGVDVIRQMGLETACRDREVRFEKAVMLSQSGSELRSGNHAEFDQRLGGYILFRRGDLQSVLFEAVKDKIEVRYGTQVVAIRDQALCVEVDLSNGKTESFDYVFGADGIHSRTRDLSFGEGFIVPMGGQYIALTIDYHHGLPPDSVRSYFGTGQSVHMFLTAPDRVYTVVYHGDGDIKLVDKNRDSVKSFLVETYADFAPEVRLMFDAINNHSFVFVDLIGQVRMPSIVKGRIALVGDAAHCPTFMAGMGSSLALQGARALSTELARRPNEPIAALQAYEHAITPIAKRYQASAMEMKPMLLDRRPWISMARNLALRLTPEWLMERRIRQFYHIEKLTNESAFSA